MIPKPPFAADLSLEEEIAAFESLQPRLRILWNALSAREEEPFTSVVVPSMTLDPRELQILGGPVGHTYLGCQFPAANFCRGAVQQAAFRIGAVLAGKGVVSRFGIDFVSRRRRGASSPELFAIETNLRIGGTTHPFLALRFLTGGRLDPETGLFHSRSGLPKFYRSTDNLKSRKT